MAIKQPIVAVILAGGLGTRFQKISADTPKSLAKINGRPFIKYQFEQLYKAGVRRFIISTGHLSGSFPKVLGHSYRKADIIYCSEMTPLGTAGAIKNAVSQCQTKSFFVLNGDSYLNTHLDKFLDWHTKKDVHCSILITKVKDTERFGTVKIDKDGLIRKFVEKSKDEHGYISSGYYIFDRQLIDEIPVNMACSLEYECFPVWIGQLGGFYRRAKFIDIGTPESYKEAQTFFQRKKKK